ncbi:MAG: LAGLIDADG family homing endonuclease [archaeon]|jgi:hypothetical protein
MLSKDYILGFVEGEGCFSIGLGKNIDRKPRKTIRKNNIKNPCLFVIKPSFRVTSCDLPILNEIKQTLGIGSIQIQRRAETNANFRDTGYFYTKSLSEALVVKDYFKDLEFHTSKGKDYLLWCEAIEIIQSKRHLTKEGLLRVCGLRDQMNQRMVKKKWTTQDVEVVLKENPNHISSNFEQTSPGLVHNKDFDLNSWIAPSQGNNRPNRPTKQMAP